MTPSEARWWCPITGRPHILVWLSGWHHKRCEKCHLEVVCA
jgi:hypothetical protein